MVNNTYEHENDAHESGSSWSRLLLGGLLIGLLLGGLTGAVTMLLVAPQSGKRTRAKLYRQGAEWREQAADTMDDALASARDKARQITQT
jgi:gas vesicle protein